MLTQPCPHSSWGGLEWCNLRTCCRKQNSNSFLIWWRSGLSQIIEIAMLQKQLQTTFVVIAIGDEEYDDDFHIKVQPDRNQNSCSFECLAVKNWCLGKTCVFQGHKGCGEGRSKLGWNSFSSQVSHLLKMKWSVLKKYREPKILDIKTFPFSE